MKIRIVVYARDASTEEGWVIMVALLPRLIHTDISVKSI